MTPDQVPSGPLLIDTDVFSYGYRRRGPYEAFEALTAGHPLALSFATVGELLAGAQSKGMSPTTATKLRAVVARYVVLPYNERVTELWATLSAKLSGHLHRGGANDMWTAACALALPQPIPIVTNNLTDFGHIKTVCPALVIVHPDT